jgi:hypothetical protein
MAKKKNPAAVALGKLGGTARAKSLSPAERSRSARTAALARAKQLTKAERRRIATKAAAARWPKKEKP